MENYNPRIYVADLSAYNDGRLVGEWIDLKDFESGEEVMQEIATLLEKWSKLSGEVREEFAIHDYEYIPESLASEYMSEADFDAIYRLLEVSEESNIPAEVISKEMSNKGEDDPETIAENLMFVVDGYDTSDIVAEYEDQIGELGQEFWSNHIFIDDVTERVIYGEDVDRFREDIISENPDIDPDEAEAQAEEMADQEAEEREDLTTYLENLGYDTIPQFVTKDYQGAWDRSLSYDFDVISHDGKMYVFSSNYAKGGRLKEFAKGGSIENQYVDLDQKINWLNQQIEADYRNGEVDETTDKYENELDKLLKKREVMIIGKDSYSDGGQLEAFAVGGKIGSDITFNSWDEEKRSGTIVEILDDGAYAVSVDTGMVLVYPKEVISYNKPVERKKLFGIFANGGRTVERKHVNKSEDYEVRYAKNHPHRTGYKGNQKFAKGGSINPNREKLMDLLENKYNLRFVRTTEDFDGSRNGIWIAGDNSEELKGDVIFDYYNRSAKYTRGVLNTFRNAIEKLGWRFEWNDPATMMLYKDSDYEQGGSLKKKELTKGVEAFANGGEVRFVSNSEDKLSRPSLDIIDLMKKNQNEVDSDLFVGNFGWKTSSNKLADGYLYKLDDFDKKIVKDFKLKPEETIYRFVNRTTAIAGMIPFIKINTEKGLLYFAKYNDSDEIIGFETKGIKASWVSVLSDKFAKGGTTDEEYIDLFEDHENIPAEVQVILDKHEKSFIDGDYKGLEQAHNELMKIGYTFEAYLDGVPYDLRPIGTKGKSEMYE
jgi:antirestriction protein